MHTRDPATENSSYRPDLNGAVSLAPENDVNQTGTILFVLKLIKNGISEILDNGSGNGIIGCNGGSGSARSIDNTDPAASHFLPVAGNGSTRLGKINGDVRTICFARKF